MRRFTNSEYLTLFSLFVLCAIYSCQTEEMPETEANVSFFVDGEEILIEPNIHAIKIWRNVDEEYDRFELHGDFPQFGEYHWMDMGIVTFKGSHFEEGDVQSSIIRWVDYEVDLEDESILVSHVYDHYEGQKDLEDFNLAFQKISDSRLIGEVSLTFMKNNKETNHVIKFDIKAPEGSSELIGYSFTTGGGDGGDGGDGDGDGGNGGSSGNCGMENYNGPEFDVQVDSQCKLAYAYDCAGEIEKRNAVCALYYKYGNAVWTGSGSLPDCPYCP